MRGFGGSPAEMPGGLVVSLRMDRESNGTIVLQIGLTVKFHRCVDGQIAHYPA